MATFTNFATLTYNGVSTNSNTVTGEILEAVFATKTAVTPSYGPNDTVTYAISLINSSTAAVTGLTLTDDLGGYAFGATTVYPLAYTDGSIRYYINGVLQAAPAVNAGPPLAITGISVPAGGNAMIIYETTVTAFAPIAADSSITNTVTVTGGSLTTPVTASETINTLDAAELNIRKSVDPVVVTENGQLTYTFVIENTGNTDAVATDDIVLSDNFDPILTNISVTLNGTPLSEGTGYTYDEASGAFATVAGQITVPAASYVQNADGSWTVIPGTATLVVSGTV